MGWHIINGPEAGAWVTQQINGSFRPGSEALALVRDGKIAAGVLYEDWNGRSIVAHIALQGRMTPKFLAAIFHYPFEHCGAHKIICPIPSDNARSIALAKNMGFRCEAVILDASPTGDILIHTLIKTDCRFLGERYLGKIRTQPAAST